MNIALWVVQVLVGLLFLFAGGMKFVMTAEQMQPPPGGVVLPVAFLRFIGLFEILGGLGVLLPGLLGIRPGLTPLAAAGLGVIMIGATVVGLMGPDLTMALLPAVVGGLAAFVAYGRWRLLPHRPRGAGAGLRPRSTRS